MKLFSLLAALLLALAVRSQTSDTVHVSLNKDLKLQNNSFKTGDTVTILTQTKMPVPVTLNGKLMEAANDTTAKLAFSVYSDLIGLGSNQPNGLVQTEGAWSWNLNVYRENPYYRAIRREEKLKLRGYKNARNDSIEYWENTYKAAAARKKEAMKKETKHPLSSTEMGKDERDFSKADKEYAVKRVELLYQQNREKVRSDRRDQIAKPIENNTWQVALFKNVVAPILTISKIDNQNRFRQVIYYDSITSTDTITQRYIHTFDLIRYSNVSIATKVNVLYLYFNRPKINVYFDFYGGLYSTGVRDTTLSKDNFYVYSRALGFNFRLSTNLNQKVNIEGWFTSFYLTLQNNDVYQKTGALHFPDSNPDNNIVSPGDRDGKISPPQKSVWTLGLQLVITPSPKNLGNKVFFRYAYFKNSGWSTDKSLKGIHGNNFVQFQVGYRKSIDIRNL